MASMGEAGRGLKEAWFWACRNAVAMAIINFANSLTLFPQHDISENATNNYSSYVRKWTYIHTYHYACTVLNIQVCVCIYVWDHW